MPVGVTGAAVSALRFATGGPLATLLQVAELENLSGDRKMKKEQETNMCCHADRSRGAFTWIAAGPSNYDQEDEEECDDDEEKGEFDDEEEERKEEEGEEEHNWEKLTD